MDSGPVEEVVPPTRFELCLEVLPSRIDPTSWGRVWDEALSLLQEHPLGLLRLRLTEVLGMELPVLTRQLEDRDAQGRFFRVVGDAQSMILGEAFTVHRKPPCAGQGEAMDIIFGEPDAARGWAIFGDDTDDAPYSLPLLAVATLFENAFEGAALAFGDLDPTQAARARRLAERSAGRALRPLVTMDAQALSARLRQRFCGPALIDALLKRHLGPPEEGVCAGLRAAPEAAEAWLKRALLQPGRLRAYQIAQGWLMATDDLQGFLRAAGLDEDGPQLPPEFLALTLAHLHLLVEPSVLRSARSAIRRSAQLPLASALSGLLNVSEPPRRSPDALCRCFESVFPGQGQALLALMQRQSVELQAVLEDAARMLSAQPPDVPQMRLAELSRAAEAFWTRPRNKRFAAYLAHLARSGDADGLRGAIVSASAGGLVLSETAWAWLGQERVSRRLLAAARLALWVDPDAWRARDVAWALDRPERVEAVDQVGQLPMQ